MSPRSKLFAVLCWGGVALTVAAFATFAYTSEHDRRAQAIHPEDGCLAYAAPPALTMILSDKTDPLLGDQPRRWRAELDEEIGRLPPGSVLLVGSIGPNAPTEMTLEKLCIPILGRGARAAALQTRFDQRLDAMAADLEHSPSTPKSAISATIAASAADRAFRDTTTGPRRLVVNSDLLENDAVSAYGPGPLSLPPLGPDALAGATVRFNVLTNRAASARQTRPLIEVWKGWAQRAGAASIEVDAPLLGYAPRTKQEAGR